MAKYHVGSDGTVTDSAGNERPDIAAKAGNLLPNDHRGSDPARAQALRAESRAQGKYAPGPGAGGKEKGGEESLSKYIKGALS